MYFDFNITLSESRSGRAALRREQREPLESKHRAKPIHGDEGETKHRCRNRRTRKRNGGTPVGHSGRMTLRRKQCDMKSVGRASGARGDVHF
jgi:hypothetical protein